MNNLQYEFRLNKTKAPQLSNYKWAFKHNLTISTWNWETLTNSSFGKQRFLSPVEYPCWKDPEPGGGPHAEEEAEGGVAGGVEPGVVQHLGQLQADVATVVRQQNQRPAPDTSNINIGGTGQTQAISKWK